MNDKELNRYIKKFNKFIKAGDIDIETALRLLIEARIYTKSGRLRKAYKI